MVNSTEKIESGQCVGAMQPVVQPDQILSKQSIPDYVDSAFDALRLTADDIPDEEESYNEAGDYIRIRLEGWIHLIGPFSVFAVCKWFDINKKLKIVKKYLKGHDKNFIDPDDMEVTIYKPKSALGRNSVDEVAGKKVKENSKLIFLREYDIINAVHIYSYKGKKIFGYAGASFTKLTAVSKNFYFNMYDSSLSKYEYWYAAWAANKMRIGVKSLFKAIEIKAKKCEEEKELERMESGDATELDKLMDELGIDVSARMESASAEQDYIFFFEDPELELYDESGSKIDDDIRPMISKLNKKGYKTRYSCSGHPSARSKSDVYRDGVKNGKLYSSARIVFDDVYDFPNIPDGWSKKILNRDEEDMCTAIYVKPPRFHIIDGLPEKQFTNWKNRYMYQLENWVDSLPNKVDLKSDDGSKLALESVMEELMIESAL